MTGFGNKRAYLQPVAWLAEKDGIYQYVIAVVFQLSSGKLAYVRWSGKRFLYHRARYIEDPVDPALTAKSAKGANTLFDREFDIKKRIKLGDPLPEPVWKALKIAAEGEEDDKLQRKPTDRRAKKTF